MGKPKFSRKKYETPSHPWQEDRIKAESELIKKYGLKNNREVWKAKTTLKNYRGQARELLGKIGGSDPQTKKQSEQLLVHLTRLTILPLNSTLDDVLALEIESILSRRLQTLTYLKGLAGTPTQARQLITHGHIAIGGRKITIPSYMVTKNEEGQIGYLADSPLTDVAHPARPHADLKSVPIKKEIEPEKQKEEKPAVEIPPPEKKDEAIVEKKEQAEPIKKETAKPEKQTAEKHDKHKEKPAKEIKEKETKAEDKAENREGGK
jgi:small subunit ribosomal protein S4